MCMITYVPAGSKVPANEILNGATHNDMGHGWAVVADTGIILTGRFWDADAAVDTFERTRHQYMEYPAVFHSRLATHGDVSLANIHPFPVGKFSVVAHNGILPSKFQPAIGDNRSDTAILAQNFLPGWGETTGIWTRRQRRRIGRIIGSYNKLVILSASPYLEHPKGWIVNEHSGQWHGGCWFSNTDYKSSWYSERRLWGWGSDDYAIASRALGSGSGKSAVESAQTFLNGDECICCYSRGTIDYAAYVCRACLSCQDCGGSTDTSIDVPPTDLCTCHIPAALLPKRDDSHAFSEEVHPA